MIYAAPLQGYTEAAWRNAHEHVFGGVDAYYTPFVRLEKGDMRNKDKRELSALQNSVRSLVPQCVAATPDELQVLVGHIVQAGYKDIDLNMGCPFPLIANHGKGAGLLPYPERIKALLDTMAGMPGINFSVKMRLGWQSTEEWRVVLPLLNASSVSRIVLHPRVGKQQYKGMVDRLQFEAFYKECQKPLVYNGDLCTVEEMQEVMERFPRLHGIMLGRGLLANSSLAMSFREGKSMQKTILYKKVYEMHQLVCEQYERTLEGGEAQLLAKLKTMWEYLLPDMEKKSRKAILKSTRLETYMQAVRMALFNPSF